MNLRSFNWLYLFGITLIVLACAAPSLAGEPTQLPTPAPRKIEVKPGTFLATRSGSFEPSCFEVLIGAVVPEERISFELEVRNTSGLPIKVLGADAGCSRQGCIKPTGRFPIEIPPSGVVRVETTYVAPRIIPGEKTRRNEAVEMTPRLFIGATNTWTIPYRITATIQHEQ